MDFLNNNMFSILLYNSPLEQFEVFSIFIVLHATISKTFFNNIFIYFFGILSSNVFIMLVLISFFLFFSFFVLLKKNKLFPNYNLFFFFEIIFDFIQSLIKQNIGNKKDELIFNNILLFIFILILFGNLFGMVPYSYTITSHLIFTFALSLSIFLGINIIAALSLKWSYFQLFFPSGVPLVMGPFLIVIELISYLARVFSLAIRLFANLMSGHTLLKILSLFTWIMFLKKTLWVFGGFFPLCIIIVITGLEIVIAMLQAYVFTILVCIYINDIRHLH